MSSWANLVSLSVILLYAIPAIRWFQTGRWAEWLALVGMMGTVALNETVKHALIGTQSPRPANAADCNLWVNDGPCGGKPGMPSGHSAQVSFLAAYYLQEAFLTPSAPSSASLASPSTAFRFFALLLVGYALVVMYSRYVKQCHTPTQILMGALLGTSASVIVLKKAYQWRDK